MADLRWILQYVSIIIIIITTFYSVLKVKRVKTSHFTKDFTKFSSDLILWKIGKSVQTGLSVYGWTIANVKIISPQYIWCGIQLQYVHE